MFWPKNDTQRATLGSLPAISKIWAPLVKCEIWKCFNRWLVGCLSRGLEGTWWKIIFSTYLVIGRFGKNSQKQLKIWHFQNCCFKNGFWDFFPKRPITRQVKNMIFHQVPSRPLDRHPTSYRLKHFQISYFTRGTKIFDIAGREPRVAHWVSFFGQNISKLVLPKYFGGHWSF